MNDVWRWGVVVAMIAACGDEVAGPDGGAPDAAVPDDDPGYEHARCGPARRPLPELVEDRGVYDQDGPPAVWTVYLTVTDLEGWAAVNENLPGASVAALLQDETFGKDAVEPNATVELRGATSRLAIQKSYKIHLADGLRWRGQEEINLNKHPWDLTRLRNKLSFDLFRSVPHLTSLRTQFVDLYVNGESHGLYTWIEEPDVRFLRSHGLDPDGQLYKPVIFGFKPIDAETRADPEALRAIIESKANPDDAKLFAMIDAVNDPRLPVDELLDRYFHRENLVTWIAVNLLLNNIDTRTQNYYLYSPSTCDGWYFLPWDYDGAWGFYAQVTDDYRERWERGLANWWPVRLMKRVFREPALVDAIVERAVELSQGVLTDAAAAERLAAYRDLVAARIGAPPDVWYLPGLSPSDSPADAVERWEAEVDRIGSTITRFLDELFAVHERPMPAFIGASTTEAPLVFRWDESFDLQGDAITYDLEIARDPGFGAAAIVLRQLDLVGDAAIVEALPPGAYFWRVIIRDHKTDDSWQLPYDAYQQIVVP